MTGIMIQGITKEELADMLNGKNTADIPDIDITAKQAQKVLNVSYNTLMQYVTEGLLKNTGTRRPVFSLKEAVQLANDKPRYKRYRELS